MKEEHIHNQVVSYLKWQYPDLIFTSDASGLKLPMGLAVKFSKLKSGKGIPDLHILEPRKGYFGLFIELKAETPYKRDGTLKKNEHLLEQQIVLNRLDKKGYVAKFATGFDEAKAITEDDLIAALDGLPEENLHCAHLAIITLENALKTLQ